jgi:hypothetical protein
MIRALSFENFCQVMPPDNARWSETVVSLMILTLLALLLSGRFEGSAVVSEDSVYLDDPIMVTLDMDHCTLRFLPTLNLPSPNKELKQPKLRAFLVSDELVTLETDTCSNHYKISVMNRRDPALKYLHYKCDIEILVPEGVVLPGLIIREHGSGYPSMVRAGPMDLDTRGFGLRLGPNALRIEGEYMKVRLQNVTAKQMHFDVKHGEIIALDLSCTDPTEVSTL